MDAIDVRILNSTKGINNVNEEARVLSFLVIILRRKPETIPELTAPCSGNSSVISMMTYFTTHRRLLLEFSVLPSL